ncbi:MAG: acyl-CoA dehydrogenase [Deltaproteobacteria bacterium RBG_16_54_11]|nr:MAG: acyl-CoA dehydrogenase [Deltaproteobacteria bacterium RBG_16_54_11]
MGEPRQIKGGGFLIESIAPREILTPEDFTKEQQLIAKAATEFVLGEVLPVADDIENKKEGLVPSLLKKAGELGFLSGDIPEEYGGQDLDKVSVILMMENLSRGGGSFMAAYGVHTGPGTLPIVFFGSQDQKRRYLPKMATGEFIAAYALTEPEAGSDAVNAKTTATLSPDGKYYILNGQKQFITNAGIADTFVTYAKVDGDKFTSFIVERTFKGVSVDEEENKMGLKGSSTRSVIFEDVKVPAENLLGEIGKGHIVALNVLNMARFSLGAGCLGGAKMALQEAVTYAKKRVQFGRPIAEFGLIKQKIGEMAIRTFIMESMIYRTGGLTDLILRPIDRHAADVGMHMAKGIEEYAIEDSINKIFCSEMAGYIIDEAVQIHGGYGYIHEYPVERGYRDLRISRVVEGTNEINRLLIMDMLVKRAMKNRLPMLDAAQKVANELPNLRPKVQVDDEKLSMQKEMVEMARKIALLVTGAAVQKYMMQLPEEQEILGLLSDMAIEVFAMESGLLRALKSMAKSTDEKAQIQMVMVKVYVNEAFERLESYARQALAAIAEGDALKQQLSALEKITRFGPVNTVALRREVAQYTIKRGRYPW